MSFTLDSQAASGEVLTATASPAISWRIPTALTLSAIVAAAVALRLVAFHGYWGTDDGEYALLANAMAQGHYWEFVDANYVQRFNGPAHLPYRIGMVAPLAFMFRLFGVSEPVLVVYPLLISVFGLLLAFVCGKYFFGTRGGLIAAALWAVVPIDVTYATSYLPDGIASFYASAAVLVVVWASARRSTERTLWLSGLSAGLLFGISWLCKESVTYLVPLCAMLFVTRIRHEPRRTMVVWLGVAVAAGAVLAAEMTYYGLVRGDFLLRMHANERSFVQTQSYLFYEGSRFGWPVGGSRASALIKRLLLDGPTVLFFSVEFLYLPVLGLIAAARALFFKDSAFTVPALWLLSLMAMFNFASPSFETYTPLVLLHRYLMPMVLPAAVLAAGLLVRLLDRGQMTTHAGERLFWGGTLAVAMLGIVAHSTFRELRDLTRVKPMYELHQAAALAAPESRVYTDPLSRKALQFYWKYPPASGLIDFEAMTADAIAPGSFVLVDTNRLAWLDVNVSMWLTDRNGYDEPSFSKVAPATWKPVWRNEYATLYRVD